MAQPISRQRYPGIQEAIHSGNWDAAEAKCRNAWERDEDPILLSYLGIVAAKRGQPRVADPLLDRAFKALAPAGGIRPGLTEPVCEFTDPDLACRLLGVLADTHGDHPQLRPRSTRTGHWSASLLAGLRHASRHWPAMNEFQVRALQAALGSVAGPVRVLEWGCGHSTLYFSGKLGADATWDAIEHDESWSRFVSGEERRSGGASVRIHHVPADAPLRHPDDDGDAGSFGKYIAYPATLGRSFGFILVDGRARVECLREAWRLLRPGGIMALHDSEREEYLPGYPSGAYRIALHAPALREQTRITFFLKSARAFAAFSEALEECLPPYVESEAARPGKAAYAAAST